MTAASWPADALVVVEDRVVIDVMTGIATDVETGDLYPVAWLEGPTRDAFGVVYGYVCCEGCGGWWLVHAADLWHCDHCPPERVLWLACRTPEDAVPQVVGVCHICRREPVEDSDTVVCDPCARRHTVGVDL